MAAELGKLVQYSQETSSEKPQEFRLFTDRERITLNNDGAVAYRLGEDRMMRIQREVERQKGYPIDEISAPRVMEVAIYSSPDRFFVPDTFGKTMAEQERLVKLDAEQLRVRLGLPDIDEILPEVPEPIAVLYKHLVATGAWLLNEDYKDPETHGYRYMITKTASNKDGSYVAGVGFFVPFYGSPAVNHFPVNRGNPRLGAARWVVAKKQ